MQLARGGIKPAALRTASAILLAAVVTGCHVPGTGASGTNQVTVGVVPGIDNAPLSVGVANGIFDQHGLHVTVKNFTSLKDELAAAGTGEIQVAGGDYTDFLYAQATGKVKNGGLRFVADGYDAAPNSLAILSKPGKAAITSPQQLAGKVVATSQAQVIPLGNTPSPYNGPTLAAQQVLRNVGVSPSSVTWKQMPPADEVDALASGQGGVRAILVGEPYILQAEEKLGAVEVTDVSTGVTAGLPLSGYFTPAGFADKNPSTITAFQAALAQAQADCAQRGLAQAELPKLTKMSADDASLVTLGTYPTSVNAGQVQRVATLMYEAGMISTPLSVSAITAS